MSTTSETSGRELRLTFTLGGIDKTYNIRVPSAKDSTELTGARIKAVVDLVLGGGLVSVEGHAPDGLKSAVLVETNKTLYDTASLLDTQQN